MYLVLPDCMRDVAGFLGICPGAVELVQLVTIMCVTQSLLLFCSQQTWLLSIDQ